MTAPQHLVRADLVAQQGEDVGGGRVGEVGRGDFEHQLTDRVGAGVETVGDVAHFGDDRVRRLTGGRRRRSDWGGADVGDGLEDHCPHGGFIKGRRTVVGERGEAAGDQFRNVAAAGGDGEQGPLGQAVVEHGRGLRAGVSHAGLPGAGGNRAVDHGQGAGDVQEPTRLRTGDTELRGAVRRPRGVPERRPDPGGMRVTHPDGEHRHRVPDIVHRLPQPSRHLPGPRHAERRPHRIGAVLLVLAVLTHTTIALRTTRPHQGLTGGLPAAR